MAKRKDKGVKKKRALPLKCNTSTYHVESSNSRRNHLSRSKKDTTVQEKDARNGGRTTIHGLTLQDPSTDCRGRDHTSVSGRRMRSGCATNNQQIQVESRVISRFFKFIPPDFEAELRLPPRFCRKLYEKIPEQAFLGSCKGLWEVTIGKRSNGLLSLCGKGWKSFIHDHELKFGDFMVFEHTGGMVFKTYVFDPSACEKDYSSVGSENLTTKKVPCAQPRTLPNVAGIKEEEEEEAVGSYNPDNPRFRVTIKGHNVRCNVLTIPSEFVNSKYLNQKTSVTLRNAFGGAWQVKLKAYRTGHKAAYEQVVMAKGWGDFHKSNQLKIGDVCLFELDRSTTLGSPNNAVMNVRVMSSNIPSTS